MAAVVGYYFGQRPVEAGLVCWARAQDARNKEKESNAKLTQSVTKNVPEITAGEETNKRVLGVVKNIAELTGDVEYSKKLLGMLENLKNELGGV